MKKRVEEKNQQTNMFGDWLKMQEYKLTYTALPLHALKHHPGVKTMKKTAAQKQLSKELQSSVMQIMYHSNDSLNK